MNQETVVYQSGETECRGYLAYDPRIAAPKPAIIIAHAWKGLDNFAKGKAETLAKLGYVGFAADVYGDGKNAANNEEALALMTPLFLNRRLLQERIAAAYEAVKKHPEVDANKIGGIGYCFGGMTIIELFRSGVDLKGAVSFHGTLGRALGEQPAEPAPIAKGIKGSLLVLHGCDDPMVSQDDIAFFENEMTEADVDWQLHIYGQTQHAFTNPEANEPGLGLIYSPKANKRSWQTMSHFFEEVFAHYDR